MEQFQLPDDLLVEILLRLPPQQPSCLVRASLVCKPWRALVTDPRFLTRLRPHVLVAYLKPTPSLGDFIKSRGQPEPVPALQFFPTGHRWWLVHDCRRGLVLLSVPAASTSLLVWYPVSHDIKQLVPRPPVYGRYAHGGFALVLLLRDDDHASRGRDRFIRIAAACVGDDGVAVATVYSSVAGVWDSHVTAKAPVASGSSSSMHRSVKAGVAVGNTAVYWLLNDGPIQGRSQPELSPVSAQFFTGVIATVNNGSTGFYSRVSKIHRCQLTPAASCSSAPGPILSPDLQAAGRHALTVLEPRNAPSVLEQNVQLMSTPDGKLGLAAVAGTSLTMWVLDHTGDGHDGATSSSWTLRRTIPLDTLLPGGTDTSSTPCVRVVGVHEDGSVVILRRAYVFFMLCVDEPTPEIHRMFETFVTGHDLDTVYPYSSNIFSRAISSY